MKYKRWERRVCERGFGPVLEYRLTRYVGGKACAVTQSFHPDLPRQVIAWGLRKARLELNVFCANAGK